jgi:hypothetical protein
MSDQPIGSAIEKNGFVYLYTPNGQQMTSILVGSNPGDGLQGFTSSTVSIKRSGFVVTYNSKGQQIASILAR